jgi:hypothetical protein
MKAEGAHIAVKDEDAGFGFDSRMCRAFLIALWQQMREQLGFSSLREPTHWIITTLSQPLAVPACRPAALQFELRRHRPIFAKQVLGPVGQGAGGEDGHPVFDLAVEHLLPVCMPVLNIPGMPLWSTIRARVIT